MPQVLRTHRPQAEPLPLEPDTDEATLVVLAKRDRRAFASLYRRYVEPVYRYCDRCLGDRELAEDATSLIFTKAIEAIASCREDAFRSWLFAIAHNVIADVHRTRVSIRPLAEASELEDRVLERSPEAHALAGDDARTIRGLLAQLPPHQRISSNCAWPA